MPKQPSKLKFLLGHHLATNSFGLGNFFTNQVASCKILGAMVTKMVATWRVAKATLFLELLHSVYTAKQFIFFSIQVCANSQTKGLERGWKQRVRLGRDAKNSLASHARLLRHALPISILILRKKTDCFAVYIQWVKIFTNSQHNQTPLIRKLKGP